MTTKITLFETNSDLLVAARDGDAWALGAPDGGYLSGTFAADAEAWVSGDWEPNEGDGQTRTTTDDLTPVAEWTTGEGVRLLVPGYQIGGAARIYLGSA